MNRHLEWPTGFPEEMHSMHEALESSESRAEEIALRLSAAEAEAAEWGEQLTAAREAAARAEEGFWGRVAAAIFGRGS